MQTKKDSVRDRIVTEAKQLFLLNGYKKTSIRAIAEKAGITSGTLYTYFRDKNALFEFIVLPPEQLLMSQMEKSMGAFRHGIGDLELTFSQDVAAAAIMRLLNLVYGNKEEFRLLLLLSSGSSKESFTKKLTDRYVVLCVGLLNAIGETQKVKRTFSASSVRIVLSMFMQIVNEILVEDMEMDEAVKYVAEWSGIIKGAWSGLLNY